MHALPDGVPSPRHRALRVPRQRRGDEHLRPGVVARPRRRARRGRGARGVPALPDGALRRPIAADGGHRRRRRAHASRAVDSRGPARPRWIGASRIQIDDFDPEAPWYGHGGAVIEHAGFYEPGGDRLRSASGGAEVELRIRCRAERLLPRPIVGFILRDRLGQNVLGDNTHLSYWSNPPRVPAGEAFTARFRFQMPYLAVGDYSLAPSIIEGIQSDHTHLQWIE